MHEVAWMPPILVSGAATVVGFLLVWVVKGRGGAKIEDVSSVAVRRDDLLQRKAELIEALRDLDDRATLVDPATLADERREVELQAAEVMKALESSEGAVKAARGDGSRAKATRKKRPTEAVGRAGGLSPQWRGAAWRRCRRFDRRVLFCIA